METRAATPRNFENKRAQRLSEGDFRRLPDSLFVMSLAKPMMALGATAAATLGVVVLVHKSQDLDRQRMHKAVERDIAEERRRKQECADAGGPCGMKPQ